MEWYEEWFNSPYYHKLYFERDEKEAEIFIRKLAHHLQLKPAHRVLDAACGKGRHSRILAQSGADVTGIDISPDSIEFARRTQKENLHFFGMICGCRFGEIILIMPLISLPVLAISEQEENMMRRSALLAAA